MKLTKEQERAALDAFNNDQGIRPPFSVPPEPDDKFYACWVEFYIAWMQDEIAKLLKECRACDSVARNCRKEMERLEIENAKLLEVIEAADEAIKACIAGHSTCTKYVKLKREAGLDQREGGK